MKKTATIFLLGLLLAASHSLYGQSCCKKPEGMQALALTKSFKASHEAPLPLNYSPEKGSMTRFSTFSGPDANAFYVPAEGSSDKVLIIFPEWWGLNDYIKREAERWQAKLGGNIEVYAVDLYDGKVASTPDEASKLASGLDAKRGEAIIKGLLQKIGPNKKIATLGWCMGGSWSFTGTILAGKQATGCVMYYGFPEKDMNKIKPLNCDVLYIRGNKDNFIKESDVLEFEDKVKKTGHNITMYSYDAVHAFANPSNPHYDKKSADDAEQYTYQFLKQKLGL
jgi:carboxymethylenebutenolidase